MRKILVLRFSSLGDIVMTTAMVRCLRKRFPKAQIDMIVREDSLDLIRHNPHLDQKITLSRNEGWRGLLRLRRQINRERYDVIYDAHRSLRTRLLMPFLDCDQKFYFEKQYVRRNSMLLFKLPLFPRPRRFLERFVDPLEPLGVEWDGQGPEMVVPPELSGPLKDRFGLGAGRKIGFVPSAQWPGKRWPVERFRQVIESLREPGVELLVFGGKQDHFCQALCEGVPEAVNLQGKLSLLEAAALIEECEYVVANDTGLMHVADALGVPTIVILGPTSEALGCHPFHPQSQVLEQHLWCRPCSKNGQAPCVRSERYCLTMTSVQDVLTAVRSFDFSRASV